MITTWVSPLTIEATLGSPPPTPSLLRDSPVVPASHDSQPNIQMEAPHLR